MESTAGGMESRTKGNNGYSLTADAIPDMVGIPYTLKRDDMHLTVMRYRLKSDDIPSL